MTDTILHQKFRTIKKLIDNNFDSEGKILNMQIDDLCSIRGLNYYDSANIKLLREAIKNKNIIAFFIDKKY